jgi:hypothetical protein
MMKTIVLILASLFLFNCGGGSSPQPPPPINPPFSGEISVQAPWAITQGSVPGPVVNGSFVFPQGDPASSYISYVEVQLPVRLNGAQSMSVTWTVEGTGNFLCTSCAPGTTPTIRLLLHQAGDTLAATPGSPLAYYRWFSIPQTLQAGTYTLTVPFVISQWIPVYQPADPLGFSTAMTHLGSVGVCFGGGDFACHGVSSDGSAFQINAVSID